MECGVHHGFPHFVHRPGWWKTLATSNKCTASVVRLLSSTGAYPEVVPFMFRSPHQNETVPAIYFRLLLSQVPARPPWTPRLWSLCNVTVSCALPATFYVTPAGSHRFQYMMSSFIQRKPNRWASNRRSMCIHSRLTNCLWGTLAEWFQRSGETGCGCACEVWPFLFFFFFFFFFSFFLRILLFLLALFLLVYAYSPKTGLVFLRFLGVGVRWGGAITFKRTGTHTWCCATDVFTCTCTHIWCYAATLHKSSSLALVVPLAHILDAKLQGLLFHLHTYLMLNHGGWFLHFKKTPAVLKMWWNKRPKIWLGCFCRWSISGWWGFKIYRNLRSSPWPLPHSVFDPRRSSPRRSLASTWKGKDDWTSAAKWWSVCYQVCWWP